MRFILAALTLIFFTCLAFSQPKPTEVHALPCKLAEIKVEGKQIEWRYPAGVDAKQSDGGRVLIVVAQAGRYPILAATITEDDTLKLFDFLLIVEGPEPLPPPKPDDPLRGELKALYLADTGADKAANIIKLQALYTQAAVLAKSEAVQSAWQLAEAVRTASKALLPGDALPAIRQRIAAVVGKALEDLDPDEPLTTETRAKAAELYARIAAALEGIK